MLVSARICVAASIPFISPLSMMSMRMMSGMGLHGQLHGLFTAAGRTDHVVAELLQAVLDVLAHNALVLHHQDVRLRHCLCCLCVLVEPGPTKSKEIAHPAVADGPSYARCVHQVAR